MALSGEMLKAFDDVKDLKKGVLNVGMTSSKANHPMPSVIPVYRDKYPNIDITITEGTSEELEEMIVSGAVDICVMNLPLSNENIDYDPIMSEKILLAAPPDTKILPGEEYSTIDISLLTGEPIILHKNGLRIRQITNSIFAKAGFKPNVILETRSIETSIRLAAAGLGFTFAPESTALYSGNTKVPKYYVIGDPPLSWTMTLAYKKDAYITKAARAFADTTKKVMSEMYGASIQ
jgi:DNA-binding transcriptional LysR family regulator